MGEKLNVIIKDSAYKLTQFTQKSIDELEDKVFLKKDKPYIKCMVRQKDIKLTPEEVVRHHRDLLQKQLDVPVLLSNVLIARLAAELLV